MAADAKPKAAQCGASVNATATSGGALRDGIGSQCTLTRTSLARMCEGAGCASVSQRGAHVDTLRVPMLGSMWWIPHWDPIPVWIFRVTDAHLQAGSDAVPVVYQTHKHNTAVFNMPNFTPTASSDDCSMWLLPARPMRARTVPGVSTKGTRCEHSQHPIWVPLPVLERPMRVLRVCMRASKEPQAGIHRIHESTLSILSDHLRYPCEYSEYRM